MKFPELSDELAVLAEKELGETETKRVEYVAAIQEWLKKNPHLPSDIPDAMLVPFIRVSKYSMERTKQRLELFFTMKTAAPEIFAGWDPQDPDIQCYLKAGAFLPLLAKDNLGRSVAIMRFGKLPPNKFKLETMIKVVNMIHVVWRDEIDTISIRGEVIINDFTDVSAGHAGGVSMTTTKKAVKVFQDCAPTRMKGIHYYNTNQVFATIFAMMKPLLKEKLRNRVHIHGNDPAALLNHFPKETLPPEYGGTGKTLKELTEHWKKRVEDDGTYLKMVELQKSDESKRPGPKRDWNAELFGIEGSFRKLDID